MVVAFMMANYGSAWIEGRTSVFLELTFAYEFSANRRVKFESGQLETIGPPPAESIDHP